MHKHWQTLKNYIKIDMHRHYVDKLDKNLIKDIIKTLISLSWEIAKNTSPIDQMWKENPREEISLSYAHTQINGINWIKHKYWKQKTNQY